MAAANRHDTVQTPQQQPATGLPNEQIKSSVDNAETNNPDDAPSPSSSSQAAAIEGVEANRDASSSRNSLLSSFSLKGLKSYVKGGAEYLKSKDEARENEIIDMVTQDYYLAHLRMGLTQEEFNRRIDKWKECEDSIVRGEFPISCPEALDYGEEWQVFYGLQLWYRELRHKKRHGQKLPPGYRTLYNCSEGEILTRSHPWLFSVRTTEATRRRGATTEGS